MSDKAKTPPPDQADDRPEPSPAAAPAARFHERASNLSGMMVFDDPNKMVIDDRFVVVSEIGRGGFGAVYKCYDQTYGRHVAIKQLLPPHLHQNDGVVEQDREDLFTLELRLQTEMQIMARLEHPNIVNVHEYVNHSETASDRYSYIVMEYLEGTSLFEHMHRLGRLPVEDAVQITEQLLNALSFIHGNDFIHRDLKPENVFVLDKAAYTLSGMHIKLLDFGLAIYKQASQRLTREGMIGGTVWYLSPEQCEGYDADEQSDLYSVGMIMFEILTGELPFKGQTHNEKLIQKLKHRYDNWRLLRTRARIHPELQDFLRRALAISPEDRFPNADAMLAELRRVKEAGHLLARDGGALPPPASQPSEAPAVDEGPIGANTAPEAPAGDVSSARKVQPWLIAAPIALLMAWAAYLAVSAALDDPGQTAATAAEPSVAADTAPPQGEDPPAAEVAENLPAGQEEGAEEADEGAEPKPNEAAAGESGKDDKAKVRRKRRRGYLSIPRMEMERKKKQQQNRRKP